MTQSLNKNLNKKDWEEILKDTKKALEASRKNIVDFGKAAALQEAVIEMVEEELKCTST